MIRIFRSYNPALLIALLLLIVLLWLQWFIHSGAMQISAAASNFIFYKWFLNGIDFFFGIHSAGALTVSCILLFIEAVYFNYIINTHRLLPKPSYLPAFCFIVLSSSFLEFISLSAPMFANFFLLVALSRILDAIKRDRAFAQIFDSSFYTAVAALIFFPYITFLLFVMFSLIFIRPLRLRELLIAVIGFILPFYLIGVYYYWTGDLPNYLNSLKIPTLNFQTSSIELTSRILFILIPLIIVTAWSILYVQRIFFKIVVQVRQSLLVLILFFAAGIFSLFIQFHGELSHFCWAIIPLSFSLSFFCVEFRRAVFSELLILFLILGILLFNFDFL